MHTFAHSERGEDIERDRKREREREREEEVEEKKQDRRTKTERVGGRKVKARP